MPFPFQSMLKHNWLLVFLHCTFKSLKNQFSLRDTAYLQHYQLGMFTSRRTLLGFIGGFDDKVKKAVNGEELFLTIAQIVQL